MSRARNATETDAAGLRERVADLARRVAVLRAELGKVVVGQDQIIEDLLVAIFAGGHVLLEGLPGLGKTLLARSLARCMGLEFSRVQFTPDLMPADVTGTRVVEDVAGAERRFRFQRGPLFANLVLADEINRATPKTQSALLEAMQEASVTVGNETHALPRPFAVVATQNPIELEGTYPLPEAQLDRFLFKLVVDTPDVPDLVRILDTTTGVDQPELHTVLSASELGEITQLARQVLCGDHLLHFVAELIRATDPRQAHTTEETKRFVRFPASPRAGQGIVLAAKVRAILDQRASVSRDDLVAAMLPALRHRVVLTFEADAEDVGVADLLQSWRAQAEERAKPGG
ncbi:MAG: AAA family ATPase [Planctomycetota bacterium]